MSETLQMEKATQLNQTLGSMLRQMYEVLTENVYSRLAEHGFDDIRPIHSNVMRYLTSDGARVTTLATQAQITKQSMSAIVDELISQGYLQSQADPSDGRARLITFTQRGQALQKTLIQLSAESEGILAKNIGEKKYAQFKGLLTDWSRAENENK